MELERNYQDAEQGQKADFYAVPNVLEYMERNYMKGIDIERLPPRFNMSRRSFFRLFRRSTGDTPYQYLMRIRLRDVQELLVKTNFPLEEIAQRCGFPSAPNMAYHFRRRFNVSPMQFRKKQKGV